MLFHPMTISLVPLPSSFNPLAIFLPFWSLSILCLFCIFFFLWLLPLYFLHSLSSCLSHSITPLSLICFNFLLHLSTPQPACFPPSFTVSVSPTPEAAPSGSGVSGLQRGEAKHTPRQTTVTLADVSGSGLLVRGVGCFWGAGGFPKRSWRSKRN